MAQKRVQYQKGLSMPEFFDRDGSVQQREERVRGWRRPNGFVRSTSCSPGMSSPVPVPGVRALRSK